MSAFYGQTHRALQEEHGTRRMADRLEELAHGEFDPMERGFIEGVSMFFLSTVDDRGRPTVSYKGGAPGFVRVMGPSELAFPSYDGNGMFLSLGNISAHPQVGLLFIDFEHPHRVRVQGAARVLRDDPMMPEFPGAKLIVRVEAEQIFVNCGRYIHKAQGRTLSPHVPDAQGHQPFPTWKRLDLFTGSRSERDERRVAEAGGEMSLEQYPGEDPG
jgi:predicted pyridoxine 5'-phosphate oxidase superfamily flavin-nucleotide-binding protein